MPEQALERVEQNLTATERSSTDLFAQTFSLFERGQPAFSERVAAVLARPLGDTPLALGYFLSLAVWMAFEQTFGARLRKVTEEEIEATMESLELDEELRQDAPDEAVETDDVIAMEQPHLVDFVREHIDIALEADPVGVEVEEVDTIYRMVLLEIVVLSYAVDAPGSLPPAATKVEWEA